MQNEYLITFKQNTELCADEEKFKNFIGAHKDIIFTEQDGTSGIVFQNEHFSYVLHRQTLGSDAIGYMLAIATDNDAAVDTFKSLLRAIKTMIRELKHAKLITLQDDVAKYYCVQAYPIIYETENLMRKLIYRIMNLSRGYEWRNRATPDSVEQSIKNKLSEKDENFLHNVDFIQLSHFLFKNYTEKNDFSDFLNKQLKGKHQHIATNQLLPYLPRSNWDRYFKDKVKVEGEQLQNQWAELYEIRNAIAHCRDISEDEFKKLVETSHKLKEKLNEALDTYNQMDTEQQQELAENLDKGTKLSNDYDLLNKAKECLEQAQYSLKSSKVNARETAAIHCSSAEQYLTQVIDNKKINLFTPNAIQAIENARSLVLAAPNNITSNRNTTQYFVEKAIYLINQALEQ